MLTVFHCIGRRTGNNPLRNHRSAVYKAFKTVDHDGHSVWACNCKGCNSDEICGVIPSSTNNTTNMWSHLHNHHAEDFTSLRRHGVLPSEIQNIAGSPSKKDSDLPVKLRPKFSIKTKREADLKATEWLLESHGSLHATENKRHRAYASFISGGAYTAPCYRTIKNHVHHHARH